MKKILSVLLASLMLISFASCADTQESSNTETTVDNMGFYTAPVTTPEDEVVTAENDVLEWVDFAEYNLKEDVPVKNIILMIGDGMGENIIKASEIVKGDKLVMSGIKNKTYVTTHSQ